MKDLFKFIASREAVLNLARGVIRFTPPDQLNDPAELLPIVDTVEFEDSLQRLRQTGFSAEQFEWLLCQGHVLDRLAPEIYRISVGSIAEANQQLQLPVYEDREFLSGKNAAAVALIRQRVGVLSLTERFDSLPMWAHYASNARGFLVAFEGLDHTFSHNETGMLNCVRAVRYSMPVPGVSYDPMTQLNLFFCKLKDWEYEAEWRVVTPLVDCRKTDAGLYLMDIPPDHISQIICGWNLSLAEIESLRQELRQINPSVRLFSSIFDGGRLSFKAENH